MLASSGEITPPTQWITRAMVTLRVRLGVTSAGAGGACACGDAVPDGDFLGADEDVFDKQPEHALAFLDGGGGGVAAQLGEEVLEAVGELEVGLAVGELGVQGVYLPAQVSFAAAQVRHPGAELVNGDEMLLEVLGHGGGRGGGRGQLRLPRLALAGWPGGGGGGRRAPCCFRRGTGPGGAQGRGV